MVPVWPKHGLWTESELCDCAPNVADAAWETIGMAEACSDDSPKKISQHFIRVQRLLGTRTIDSLEEGSNLGQGGPRLPRKPLAVPGELLVQFRRGATAQSKAEAMLPIQGHSLEAIRLSDARLPFIASGAPLLNQRGDLERVSLPDGTTADEAIRVLKMHPDVEFAQPNWIYHTLATPNDPRYAAGNLWGLYGPTTTPSNAYGMNALAAWNAGFIGSRNVFVAVIDEGAQWNHPDLIDNVWTNPFEIVGSIGSTTENVSWTNGASATMVYVAVKRYKGSSTTIPYNLTITR